MPESLTGTERSPLTLCDLTPRQHTVALLIAEGMSAKEVAAKVGIAPASVKVYTERIYKQVGVDNRVKLARWVIAQKGL